MFAVYGTKSLPPINLKSKPNDIVKWKNSSAVKECYEKLHKPVVKGKKTTYMTQILHRVWPRENVKEIRDNWVAFAAAVCEVLLDSEIPGIQVTESLIEPRIEKYLKETVSF